MIIKSISAENFGKFDRYSVNLDDSINVFYGDNEAGKTTLYEIISILLFAPTTEAEIKESNKLIKSDEKYARVYAIINMDGKEISIAREIYANDTNLSIADQDNVSSLGNVNVPFIGDLSKDMYESFHTIDYYNMATITKNVWEQIVKVIEDSKGGPRRTPDYSTPEEDIKAEKQKAKYEDEIKQKENERDNLRSLLADAQRTQKRMIKNQDKIDDLISDLEDVENNIELESSYLKEANKMNQIRETIKKTQDLTLELEKYKALKPWMPNLRQYYEKLKLYTENKANGIENPIDMFDELEEEIIEKKEDISKEIKPEQLEAESIDTTDSIKEELKEEVSASDASHPIVNEIMQEVKREIEKEEAALIEQKLNLQEQKEEQIVQEEAVSENKEPDEYIEENNLMEADINEVTEPATNETPVKEYKEEPGTEPEIKDTDELDSEEQLNKATSMFVSENILKNESIDEVEVKPLEIRKPKDMKAENSEKEIRGIMNSFGQTNPYSDNVFPDMDDVNYYGKDMSELKNSKDETEDEAENEDKYSLSSSNNLPTQSQTVPEEELNGHKKNKNSLLEAERILNNTNMQEVIAASKEIVDVSDETQEEIDKAQLRYKVIAKRTFNQDMDMDDLSRRLKMIDTNAIYKTIVKYKGLSQSQRKLEQDLNKTEHKGKTKKSTGNTSIILPLVAFISLLLGLACFFIDQIATLFFDIEAVTVAYQIIMELPLNNIIPGNMLAGGAFTLIAVLLTIAIVLGSEKQEQDEDIFVDEVELDELKNRIRMAKREVIDSLGDFPLPESYLNDPNNSIITVINELREAESAYHDLIIESKMPDNQSYRNLWKVTKESLTEQEITDDLFDNISILRRKIQDYKEKKAEEERKQNETKMKLNMASEKPRLNDNKITSETVKQHNSFGIPNQGTAARSSFDLPTSQQENKINDNQSIKNASENTAFGLPTASSGNIENSNTRNTNMSQVPEPESTEQQSKLNEQENDGYSEGSGMFGNKQDTTYPGSGGMFETSKDNSYPDSGGMFSTSKGNSYPGNNEFGTEKEAGYPGMEVPEDVSNDFPASKNLFSTSQNESYPETGGLFGSEKDTSYPETDNIREAFASDKETEENPYGIPGIKMYGNDSQSKQAENINPFKTTEDNKQTDTDIQNSLEDDANPFGIPGIKMYTHNTSAEQKDNPFSAPKSNDTHQDQGMTDENPFGIPGIKMYNQNTDNISEENNANNPFSIEPKNSSFDITESQEGNSEDNNDPFGIPGIKRYTYEPPKKTENISTKEHTEAESAFEIQIDDAPTVDVPVQEEFHIGLPGLDKFSNRSQQANNANKSQQAEETDIPIVPPVKGSGETAAAIGTAVISGLPGLDKFSNRGEQFKKPVEEKIPANDEINEKPIETDPFSIPQSEMPKKTSAEENISEEEVLDTEKMIEEKKEEENLNGQESVEEDKNKEIEEIQETEEQIAEEIEVKEIKKDRREKEYDKLIELLGDDPEGTIREVEDITRSLHREITKRDTAMAELLKLNDAAVRLSTLSSSKWPYKQKAIEASQERIDYLEADKLKMKRHLDMLEEKIEKVEYEDTPQAISDKLKTVEEKIEQLKLESDKHALAEELMEKQKLLDISSSEDRSHIIDDTSVYMKELTLGKYVKVKINDDQSGLSICDKDGQWFDTTKDRLSQATREQLYLALRISIADLFDEKSIIFPMFFDEALITWDRRRMKAVMRLLSKMSMHRQVIIFTCHDWLKDMISDYLIGAKIIMM